MALIAANVIVFLLWQPTFGTKTQQETFLLCHGEIAWEVTHQTSLAQGGAAARRAIESEGLGISGTALQDYLKTACPSKNWLGSVFTAMFMHGGWLHIGGNMLFLSIFGNNVEDKIRPTKYLLLYLVGGILASVAQTAIAPSSVIPQLGASGAIAAVLGAYIVMFPRARILTLFLFFFITVLELPAVAVLGFWIALQFISGASVYGHQVSGGVAYWAHIGGFATGALAALLFFPKQRRPLPRFMP